MSFRPVNGNHAIVEAVFVVELASAITHPSMTQFLASHQQLIRELPRKEVIGVEPGGPINQVAFSRMRADGQPSWRLMAVGNAIAINCTAYTRWSEVWSLAQRFLVHAASVLADETLLVQSTRLLVTDVFQWMGPVDDYDARLLLDLSGELLPTTIDRRGPLWHVHQGWFSPIVDVDNAKQLSRLNVDATHQGGDDFIVTISNDLESTLPNKVPLSVESFIDTDSPIPKLFAHMHSSNKRQLASLLIPQIQEVIGLNA